MHKLATACAGLIVTAFVLWLLVFRYPGSPWAESRRSISGQRVEWIRVVVPDDFRGLLEFRADQAPTKAGAIEVTPDEHGIISLPQPNPLFGWHSIEVRSASGTIIPLADLSDPQGETATGIVAMVSGVVSGNRVFLFVSDARDRDDFEEAVRRAIGFAREPRWDVPESP